MNKYLSIKRIVGCLDFQHQVIDAGLSLNFAADDYNRCWPGALQLLRLHILFEENYLFPAGKAFISDNIVACLNEEHRQMMEIMKKIIDWGLNKKEKENLQNLMRELVFKIAEHNDKEEGIIYDRITTHWVLIDDSNVVQLSFHLVELKKSMRQLGFDCCCNN